MARKTETWLSLSDCQKRLAELGDSVSVQALTGYVKRNASDIPQKKEGNKRLVDLSALLSHRQTSPVAQKAPATSEPVRQSKAEAEARAAHAKALKLEMELGKELRMLVPVERIDQLAQTAILSMQQAFTSAIAEESRTFASEHGLDKRVVRAAFKHLTKSGLELFSREMAALAEKAKDDRGE